MKFYMHKWIFQFFFISVLLGIPASNSQAFLPVDSSPLPSLSSPQPFRVFGHIGGSVEGIFIQDHYAYIGFGPELVIYDITNPYSPLRLGSVVMPSLVQNMAYRSPFLYVADYLNGLQIVNVSNPSAPLIVGSASRSGYSYSIAMKGDYIFLGGGSPELSVYNVSNPVAPEKVLSLPVNSIDLEVLGNYLYATGEFFYILDITNPAAPTTVSQVSIKGNRLALAYPYAYLTWITGTTRVNIAEPMHPFTDGIEINGENNAVISGDNAYTTSSNCSTLPCTGVLNVINISTPVPVRVGFVPFIGDGYTLAVNGNFVIVSNGGYGGFRIFNVANPDNPREIYYHVAPAKVIDFNITGNYAYLIDLAGLKIVNISNPSVPALVGYKESLSTPLDIAVVGSHAFITEDYWDLRIINISNPANPVEVGSDTLLDTPYGIAGGNNVVYIGASQSFIVESVADPTHPFKIGYTSLPRWGSTRTIAIRGSFAFLPDYQGFMVVNISNPLAPVHVATEQEGYTGGEDIALGQNYAYIPRSSQGIQIINITDPVHPVHVAYFYPSQSVNGIAVDGNFAYLVTDSSLILVDLSNPTSPIEKNSYYLGVSGTKVAVKNGYIYVADGYGGFFIFKIDFASITGRVKGANGLPYQGAAVSAGPNLNTFSDENGLYAFINLLPDTYTVTPAKSGFRFEPVSRTISTPPTSIDQDFIILPEPKTVQVSPGITTTVIYSDTQGLPTSITFPTDAVSESLTVKVTPIVLNRLTNGLAFAGHAFTLEIYRGQDPLPNFRFNAPLQITVDYSDFDLRFVSNENLLSVWWLSGGAWQNGNRSCDPPSVEVRDLPLYRFSVSVCETGEFGLLGPTQLISLPVLLR